ncbi:putative baseplate assembly protein [bacterium]|nr:putative baseplate assembly protein [bacterium]
MSLPAPNLDDLRFQKDLVDEARKRIIHYCPEWTDYNLSDPGITLIELFAWMTEMMVYRLNRVPEINYVKFLEMLGFRQTAASSAQTELSFYLSLNLPLDEDDETTVTVPEGFEVFSNGNDEEITFSTTKPIVMVPPILSHVRKEGEFNKNYKPRLGIEIFRPFDPQSPQPGDTFYLGFDPKNNIAGHTLQFAFECEPTEAVGIRRDDPPWVWECLTEEGKWVETRPSNLDGEKDTTGGLNNPSGQLVLYLPLDMEPNDLYGLNAYWIRCRIEQRNLLQGMYTESPKVSQLDVHTIGGTVPAGHSVVKKDEYLGFSNGEPGQTFTLENAPILELVDGEFIEVEEQRNGQDIFVPWEYVSDFSNSTRYDRHYSLDMATGTVFFGPSIRQPDGSTIQYGRIPESGRPIRVNRYRFGGGVVGNLPAGSLTTMSMSLAYLSRVSNLVRAEGGRDQETLDEVKFRAQRELQAQRRAVTPQDYEQFTLNFSRNVARAKCLTPNDSKDTPNGTISVVIVPAATESIRANDLSKLHLPDDFKKEIHKHLDKYRLMTTMLNIREPEYTGVKVQAKVVPIDYVTPHDVIAQINYELNRYLTPLPIDASSTDSDWEGWPFGRDIFIGEIISIIQRVPTVKYVTDVEIFSRKVVPVEEKNIFDENAEKPLSPVNKMLPIPEDGLVCSLEHDIQIVDFSKE